MPFGNGRDAGGRHPSFNRFSGTGRGQGAGAGQGRGQRVGQGRGRPMPGPAGARVVINEDKCSGCMLCLKACPFNAIKVGEPKDGKKHKALIDYSLCKGCGVCIPSCPTKALFWG